MGKDIHDAALATVPGHLTHCTTLAAKAILAGHTTRGLISVQAATMAKGALQNMFVTKLRSFVAV
jgi:hypothetical protein